MQVDNFGTAQSLAQNNAIEFERNRERYSFLRWGQSAFEQLPRRAAEHRHRAPGEPRVPGRVVFEREDGDETIAYPDTLVGTDSHTTMINGLGVLGWGVGGIEAEAAMLGQPVTMLIPQVVGFKLAGKLAEGATATDLVLTVTEMLRKKGVVGKFVEFFGDGLDQLPLADRATIAQHVARVRQHLRASSRSTPRRCATSSSRAARRRRSRSSRRTRRRRACGAATQARADYTDMLSSISGPSSRASRARSARRIACRCKAAADDGRRMRSKTAGEGREGAAPRDRARRSSSSRTARS